MIDVARLTPPFLAVCLTAGRAGYLKSVVRVTNVDAAGVERADPHAVRVRLKSDEARDRDGRGDEHDD